MEMLGDSLHRLAAVSIGVGNQQHFAARERLPVRLFPGFAAVGPGGDDVARKNVACCVGALLALDHDNGSVGVLEDVSGSL